MKKVVALLVVGMLASTAGAAELYMTFPGGATEWTLAPSETVDIEIHMQLNADDTFSTLYFGNMPLIEPAEAPPGYIGLEQTAVVSATEGWPATGADGPLGDGLTQWACAAQPGYVIDTPGDYLIGYQTIHQLPGFGPWDYELMFSFDPPIGVKKGDGSDFTLLCDTSSYAGYAGYYFIGLGSPGYVDGFGCTSPANPLILHHIPEPASLSLLVLGGLALLRRRR
jgi:hypothetical protein